MFSYSDVQEIYFFVLL